MAPVEPKTVLILRRMVRKSLGIWAWSAFSPIKAGPEELGFDLLDGNGRHTGHLVCTKFHVKFFGLEYRVRTPWGEGKVEFPKRLATVFLNDREIATMTARVFKGDAVFAFPDGTVMRFEKIKGRRNDIVFRSDEGFLGFYEETGTLPEGSGHRPIPMTLEEMKALPKGDRPRSVETNDYVQFRIEIGGRLPVNQDDLVRGLCIFATFGRLMDEMPSG